MTQGILSITYMGALTYMAIGVYHLWDDKSFLDLSADDVLTHFRVNVLVRDSSGCSAGAAG